VLKFTLPSGLCVYESKLRDVYGATLCYGGPHEVFTHGYKQAGFRVTSGMLQVLFTESATAYMGGIRAVVGASIEEETAGSSGDLASVLPTVVPQPVPVGPAGDVTAKEAPENPSSAQPVEETAQPEPTDIAAASDAVGDPPSAPLPVAATEPEPAANVTAQGIPLRSIVRLCLTHASCLQCASTRCLRWTLAEPLWSTYVGHLP
jgi:hypothetical protein